ncbi:MAG: KamA family radical SAM protein [Bacteroidales bacterium]|nr:KamA family radical SAM protein [Bacteroidales bacterium]
MSISSFVQEDIDEPPSLATLPTDSATTVQNSNSFPVSQLSHQFRSIHFPMATDEQWNDWKWQVRNSFTSFESLEQILTLTDEEKGFKEQALNLPVRITPYYASLFAYKESLYPLRKTMVPVLDELVITPGEQSDPLHEEADAPVPLIVHRYPDRALLLVTGFCSAFCRYCTRSHMVSKKDKMHAGTVQIKQALEYIRQHTEIRDVIISGGDPLTLSDERIEFLLSSLRAIEHVEIIRIGTKVPAVLPMRITDKLLSILKKYHPLFMSLHFTHPDEMTPESHEACCRLADAGIPLGSQTVLLKGINDDVSVYRKLTHELLKARVKPYYLYQCDPIPGSAHFRTPVEKGIEMIEQLRGFTSGYAIPHYVIDAPGGGGKIPLLPEYYQGKENGQVVLKNYEGKLFYYPDKE